MNVSSVQGASGYDLSHALLIARRQLERGSFFVEGIDRAIASTVAVQTTSNVGGDQLRLGEVELTKDVTLLTKEVLLMVTGEEREGRSGEGKGRGRERERERQRNVITGEIST